MSADEIMRVIGTMEPNEIERLCVLIREYEAEVSRRQAGIRYAEPVDFERAVETVFAENKELLRKLAELEKTGRRAVAP